MTLNKTDRIVITLGKQIVSGKYVPGSGAASGSGSVRGV